MISRALEGALVAAAIALSAWRAGSLSRSGALAAIVVGTAAVAAGWSWGALLITYFLSSSLLTRVGTGAKAQRSGSIVAKGGARDATQVLANGGVFAIAATFQILYPSELWLAAGAGALAASAADSWGTELGMLANAPPRMITTWRVVPTGTSGGVSIPGIAATAAGALFIATAAWLLHTPPATAFAALIGGFAGALLDSFFGAIWQARLRCPQCGTATERLVHDCGTRTERAGGLGWLDNDGINTACTLAGALVAAGSFALRR
ncbi:MAG: DUF92 domain-containing protein [Gemmatimonadales bacterium]